MHVLQKHDNGMNDYAHEEEEKDDDNYTMAIWKSAPAKCLMMMKYSTFVVHIYIYIEKFAVF